MHHPIKPTPITLNDSSHTGKLYICGGQRSGTIELYQDFWCLDLHNVDAGWRQLPSYNQIHMNCPMVVSDGKAYLFRGLQGVDFFDLNRERWGKISTHFLNERKERTRWPWSTPLKDHAMVAVRGKLYVFGGSSDNLLGNNYFACLDIATRTWTHLSGTPDADKYVPQHTSPGPRKHATMWVDKKEERVYMMYGMPDLHAVAIGQGE